MKPFEPRGEQARWRTIYAALQPLSVGDVITYDDLAELLELDPVADRHAIQMAMRRAAKEYETADKHAVDPVPNVGYRVVDAPEHLILAKRQQRRAGRALQRGHSKVVNVDLSAVEPEVRSAFQVVAQAFSMQMEMNRRFDSRARRLEEAVSIMSEKQEQSDHERETILARLARLEAAVDPDDQESAP